MWHEVQVLGLAPELRRNGELVLNKSIINNYHPSSPHVTTVPEKTSQQLSQ